ncbi:FAD-binding oxidoreductase [Micromonospora sp. SH-82]|uniref:FAD-binding oxidoreductase n=1 Tax=Micromonospora sp. SH-82 TaxID=3132938 RepID=UPI003EB8C0F2
MSGATSSSMGRSLSAKVADRLGDICGQSFARLAGAADEVAGGLGHWVAAPGDVSAATEVLRLAAECELSVVPRGAGTKIDWGSTPARVDIVLDTGRLAGFGHHRENPSEIEVGAGTPFRSIQDRLARTGQRLSFDPPSTGATLGGVLAAGEAGPLRLRYGGPADQVTELRHLNPDGVLRVVRTDVGGPGRGAHRSRPTTTNLPPDVRVDSAWSNADTGGWPTDAGEQLGLLCGSNGGLGLVVQATLRTQPLPETQIYVARPVANPLEVSDLVGEVRAADVGESAIELDLAGGAELSQFVNAEHPSVAGRTVLGAGSLVVLVEGERADVDDRVRRLRRVLGGRVTTSPTAPRWWGRYPFGAGDVVLRIEAEPRHLSSAMYAFVDHLRTPVPIRGSVAAGVVYAVLPSPFVAAERVVSVVEVLRRLLLLREGTCVVVAAPSGIRELVDLWGGLPGLSRLGEIKERIDPARRLAPGRLPGGH